jgi:hypothetical protein
LDAQQKLQVGNQVRITAPECSLHDRMGTFEGLSGDTLLLAFGSSKMRCESGSVWSLDRRRKSKSKAGEGALIGLVLGGFGGAAIGAATYRECIPEGWFDCFMTPESAGEQAAIGAVIGGVLGAGIGALAGAARKGGGWERIPVNRIRTRVSPRLDGFSVRLMVSF